MDVVRDPHAGFWWLDECHEWRWTHLRLVAWWRARAARRAELRVEVYGMPGRKGCR